MKIGIVGAGLVGATAAYALLMRGIGREIVLVDRNEARAAAEADDLLHAVPFAHPLTVRAGGYPQLAGAAVVVVSAGVAQAPGEHRGELLARNACVFADVVPQIIAHAPESVIVVATNPVDVMTHVADRIARNNGVPAGRVLGTGTMLDSARFRTLLAGRVGVDAQHVHAYVLGEHGDTEVLAWSAATVGGLPLDDFCSERGLLFDDDDRIAIDDAVRNAAYRIIEGKGATYYGVGSAIARIVDTVIGDRRSVLTVSAPVREILGVGDVAISLPRLVSGSGVIETFDPRLSAKESVALGASAQAVREAITEAETAGCA